MIEEKNNQYDTLAKAHEALINKGYKTPLDVEKGQLVTENGNQYPPKEVSIDQYHRFEGMSNPADSSVIYALSTDDGKKGILIDAYSAKSSDRIGEFLKKCEQ